jgi:hypothetical protein
MPSFKDDTDISLDNILKLVVESLTTDEQQQYEDYMRQAKEKFLSQYTRWITTRRWSNMERPTLHLF